MHNIKVCPTCNQASPNANISFCPYDGTALVEMQPMHNQQVQPPSVIQPQVSPLTAPKKKMNPLLIGCLALIAIPIIFAILIPTLSAIFYSAGVSSGSNTNKIDISVDIPSSKPLTASPTSSSPAPSSLPSDVNFGLGKKALSEGNTDKAIAHLTAIPKTAKEYKQAQSLLKKMKKEEKQINPQERNDAEKFRDSIQRLSDSIRNK